MPSVRNLETEKAISAEIKTVQGRCVEAINIIENAPPEIGISPEKVTEKALSYVEGLRTEIQNFNTPITTDDNLLTSQFLIETQNKTAQLKDLAAYMKGTINDVDAEIKRLTEQIQISKEARSRPIPKKQQIKPEHLRKAKECFQLLKTELHSLVQFLYPDNVDEMKAILGVLMSEKISETSNGYIQITTENYRLVELLLERNIVSFNPYNNMEVKLAF